MHDILQCSLVSTIVQLVRAMEFRACASWFPKLLALMGLCGLLMMESIKSSRPLTPKTLSLRHGKQQSRSRALTETARAAKAWNAEASLSLSQKALEEPSIQA